MTLTVSITESDLLTALRAFLLDVIGGEVIQSQDNRVPMPSGNFCTMTPLSTMDLSTPRSGYADPGTTPGNASYARSVKWPCQLDFYGTTAADHAAIAAGIIRTPYACTFFAGQGIDMQPLYAGEPRQNTLINGQQQFEPRWTLDFIAQYNPVVTTPQDFASSLDIGLADVDVTFPPE